MSVTVRAAAKINLYLGVGAPREDGFHPLATVYQAIGLYDDGRLYLATGWSTGWSASSPGAATRGRRNVVIKGTYGYPYPPPRVSRAALLLAKRFLVDLPVSDRATSLTTQDGTTQFLVTAGVRQAITDVPECNAVIREYGVRQAFAIA